MIKVTSGVAEMVGINSRRRVYCPKGLDCKPEAAQIGERLLW